MNLVDLDTFARVAEFGTLTEAARRLRVPKSTVSRRVARLEDALGLTLLRRTARSVALTPEGERLYARTGPALADIQEARRELEELDEEPRGALRVTAPQDFAAVGSLPHLLMAYRRRHPRVRLECFLTNRRVRLAEEGVDIALRAGGLLEDSTQLTGRRITTGEFDAGLYASPAYLAEAPPLDDVADLTKHHWVGHPAFGPVGRLRVPGPDGGAGVEVGEVLRINDFAVVRDLLVQGAGVSALPNALAKPAAARGELVQVLPAWSSPPANLWIVWPKSRHMTPRVRAFVDLVLEWADAGGLSASGPRS